MQSTKANRLRTVLAVLLLTFSIFSVAYIALEKNHKCSGTDCSICFVINIAEQNLKLLSLFVASVIICSHQIKNSKTLSDFTNKFYFTYNTLVSQKIRLNN